jgi:transcriptional regulator with XRE-family HTH domain
MFKDKLKENRTKLGLSQEDLAIKIFVSRSAVAKWEQGRGIPEEDTLAKLSVLFHIPTDELLNQEDMKEEIKANEQDLAKNKKKLIISASVAGISVVALVITLLCGAFVYNPSGEEAVDNLNITAVEKKEERVTALTLSNGTRLNYSQWRDAKFKDEMGYDIAGVSDLHLREGDNVEISYLADRNLFGQKRVGSLGLSEIRLNSHTYDGENQTLNGVGFSFASAKSAAYQNFSTTSDTCAYCRFYEINPTLEFPVIDMTYANCLSAHAVTNGFHTTVDVAVAFDPEILATTTVETYFNDYANEWSPYYYDMAHGEKMGTSRVSALILGSMSDTFAGAIPTTYYSFGYQYITYNVSVEAKNNPSSYQIKSYDASDALLKTTVVTPSTDLTGLSLPGSRAYSIVEEYQNGGLVNSSAKLSKGGTTHLYFSKASGLYDSKSSLVTL